MGIGPRCAQNEPVVLGLKAVEPNDPPSVLHQENGIIARRGDERRHAPRKVVPLGQISWDADARCDVDNEFCPFEEVEHLTLAEVGGVRLDRLRYLRRGIKRVIERLCDQRLWRANMWLPCPVASEVMRVEDIGVDHCPAAPALTHPVVENRASQGAIACEDAPWAVLGYPTVSARLLGGEGF